MSEKIKHTPGPYFHTGNGDIVLLTDHPDRRAIVKWPFGEICTGDERSQRNADYELLALAPTAPHDCDDPQCPGAINKRKLEAFDALLAEYSGQIERLPTRLNHDAYASLLRKADEWDRVDWETASRYERHAVNAAMDIRELLEEIERLKVSAGDQA